MDNFLQRRAVALAILTHAPALNRRQGSFLGQCVADDTPLSDKQNEWLFALANRAGIDTMETAQ